MLAGAPKRLRDAEVYACSFSPFFRSPHGEWTMLCGSHCVWENVLWLQVDRPFSFVLGSSSKISSHSFLTPVTTRKPPAGGQTHKRCRNNWFCVVFLLGEILSLLTVWLAACCGALSAESLNVLGMVMTVWTIFVKSKRKQPEGRIPLLSLVTRVMASISHWEGVVIDAEKGFSSKFCL